MTLRRNIAGVHVIVESPSRLRICNQSGTDLHSWLIYTGDPTEGWTITWDGHGGPRSSGLKWPSAWAAASFMVKLGKGEGTV